MEEEAKKEIRKIALQNAFEHEGKTQDKIVLAKILGTKPEFRTRVKEISEEIKTIVSEINQLTFEEQKKVIEENFPDILIPKEKTEEREGLPPLKNAEHGKVVTRFPPEPNGYPHIGHAKAAIINAEYAKMYGGKFILRMDDTNPEAERMEYHAAIKVGLDWFWRRLSWRLLDDGSTRLRDHRHLPLRRRDPGLDAGQGALAIRRPRHRPHPGGDPHHRHPGDRRVGEPGAVLRPGRVRAGSCAAAVVALHHRPAGRRRDGRSCLPYAHAGRRLNCSGSRRHAWMFRTAAR